jgi:predicted TIM-barrel enzyme
LIKAKSATKLPVLIGSGMTAENIEEYLPLADGFIVGFYFRRNWKPDDCIRLWMFFVRREKAS